MDPTHCFFLQAIDPDYGCPVLEAMFEVGDPSIVQSILGARLDDDLDLRGSYWLDAEEVSELCERFDIVFEPGDREVKLCRWHSLRTVPYLVHTNYELFLMLEGRKKFARMNAEYPPHDHDNEELFERHVAAGVLYREIDIAPFPTRFRKRDSQSFEGMRTVYYTLKGEEWRIDAWRLLFAASQRIGWNETFERLEGMLFGYTEWQIDWWMRRWRKPPAIHIVEPVQNS